MDETAVRAMLERLAGDDAPPPRVDIGRAQRQGRKARRWRRAGLPGAAALATAAVIGLFASGLITPGQAPLSKAAGSVARPLPAGPAQFNPLLPYAAFSVLVDGYVLETGGTSPDYGYLTAGPAAVTSHAGLSLEYYAAATCRLTGHTLRCPDSADVLTPIAAAAVRQRTAYWDSANGGFLIWEYARDSWAKLSGQPGITDLLKIANGVRFGYGVTHAVVFPVQLPASLHGWRLASASGSVTFRPYRGTVVADQWYLTRDRSQIMMTAAEGGPSAFCPAPNMTAGQYRVNFQSGAGLGQEVCASVGGISIDIITDGPAAPGAISVFRGTRFLGRDPARWTTRPVG